MMNYNLTAILYGQKNYDLHFNLSSICKKKTVFLVNCTDFIELTIKNAELRPQFIFCDLDTTELLDYKIEAFKTREEFKNVTIIFISKNGLKNENLLFKNNWHYVNIKDFESIFDKCLHEVDISKTIANTYAINNNQLNYDIFNLLNSLGFSSKYIGYSYLCDCIKNVIINNGIIHSLTAEQYVYVATKFKTNVVNIERNIRNVITETWKIFGDTWFEILMAKSIQIGMKPTNREFINMCSNIILMNAKYQIKTIK